MIEYNSQRDNYDFSGKFKAWWQCFTTSAWMLMSHYTKKIKATDDAALAAYLDDIETSVGKPGIGEKVKQKFKWITGSTSYWWLVQKEGIESWLWARGVDGECKLYDGTMPIMDLLKLAKKQPVILGTNKMGGLPGGHIILVIDSDGADLICHDPFGDATTRYSKQYGAAVAYNINWIKPYIAINGNNCRCMIFNKK